MDGDCSDADVQVAKESWMCLRNGGTYVDVGGRGGGGGDDSCNTEEGDRDGGGDDDCRTVEGSKGSKGGGDVIDWWMRRGI